MDIYTKEGRKYRKLGIEFTGFPANGVWLVEDGLQSLIMKIGDLLEPLPYASIMKYRDKAATAYVKYREEKLKTGFYPSAHDVVELIIKKLRKKKIRNKNLIGCI